MNGDAVVHLLEPLRQPPAVPLWPPAPGWWIAAVLIVTLLVLAGRWAWRRHQRGAAIRQAKRELLELQNTDLEDMVFCEQLALLQRRVVASMSSQSSEMAATGSRWAEVLNTLAPTVAPFNVHLVTLHYSPQISSADRAEALNATQRWLQAVKQP